jgi:glycosyltransferase involved in cell wall biosynthesis
MLNHSSAKENIHDSGILLSICIPTFNRAEHLNRTLRSIVKQPLFCEKGEVIIADNCSTDDTPHIVGEFLNRYKNIRYYRNETNIGADRNFLYLLGLGQGKYLKLHNDRACFHEGTLIKLMEYLLKANHGVVFILNENTNLRKKGIIECKAFGEFVQATSYWSTWMNGIILKACEYNNLTDKDRAIGSNLLQTDIMFRMLTSCGSSLIINEKMMYEQEVEVKGGYNLFKVFVSNYLDLYQEYLKAGVLNQDIYNKEKINLFKYFIIQWYIRGILIKDKRYQFNVSKAHRIILKYYWNEPQLFFYPLYLLGKSFFRTKSCTRIFRS